MAHHASPQAHGEEEDEFLQHLMTLSSPQRVAAFRSHFRQTVVPLHQLKQPAQCQSYPAHFTNDIINAYLKYTTFTVQVRTNYDAACKKFYMDQRAEDCGKLVLGPQVERNLMRTIGNERLPLTRVCFEVSTPFQLLCNVVVRITEKEGGGGKEIRARWEMATTERHSHLIHFVDDVCVGLEDCMVPDDCEGFKLANIRSLGQAFARHPTEQELGYKRCLFQEHLCPWMDFDGDNVNEGWTDFGALGKACSGCSSRGLAGCRTHSARRRYSGRLTGTPRFTFGGMD